MQNLVIFFLIYLIPLPLRAEEAESIREVCRRQISGAYLTTYNQWDRTKDYAKLLDQQITSLKKAEVKAKAEYEKSRQEMDNNEYDVSRQRDFSAAKDRLDTIKGQINEISELIDKTKVENQMTERELGNLKKSIAPVFDIVTNKAKSNPYPQRLEFKSPCPKFRSTCPLPNRDAYNLQDIAIAGDDCRKYVTFSFSMNRK